MSANEHLQPKQFKNYKPAAEEGKAASDWLSSEGGHTWQDAHFERTRSGHESSSDAYFTRHPAALGFFGIKDQKPDRWADYAIWRAKDH